MGNEIQVEIGEKAGAGEFFEEDMGDNEDVYPEFPNIFNDKLNWKEQEPLLGFGDDEAMVDATDALDRPGDEERMVGVNGRDEGENVNARVKHVKLRKM
ncbi:unnamed protein product [Lactuca saligna]|uniref:Uncharacterized protein n=1 Tax=Lactuca saligna TaxID=75948 RepID=A0AA36E093_LACSI|nr:unnamed protein product [Lactuca saligna]